MNKSLLVSALLFPLHIFASGNAFEVLVKADVTLRSCEAAEGIPRKTLCSASQIEKQTIKKGQKIRVVSDDGEGTCSIEFVKKVYSLLDCPWLEGHTDLQQNVFEITKSKKK